MTVGNLLSQMGIGTKHLTERYSDYHGMPTHDQHVYYPYEPPMHTHHATSKHNYYYGGGKKNHAAMSALTLLAFLFFLHILQQCLREHMQTMTTPEIMIMTAGREGEEKISEINKLDKSGITINANKSKKERLDTKSNTRRDEDSGKIALTKIKTAQHTPKIDPQNYKHLNQDYTSRSPSFSDLVSVMNGD